MKILVIVLVAIVIIIVVGYFAYTMITDNSNCSFWNSENCEKSCTVDSDCRQSNCCSCLNKDESCSLTRGFENVLPNCVQATCGCVNNLCETVPSDDSLTPPPLPD